MYGMVAVALAQGLLLGLAFWFLRLPSPVLWGVITAIISLIPLVGSVIVWLPAAVILIVNGSWVKGLVLIGWGAGVVSLADNIVRPYVISKAGDFHPLLVFFALLGGVQAFGLIGLFVGPVVLAAGQALFDLLKEESRRRAELVSRQTE
jgi:predicted PurR-regulated permease PerM